MGIHVTFRNTMQSSKLGGWGENFWNTGTDLDTVDKLAKDLQELLYQVKGAQVTMAGWRLSVVPGFRQVKNTTNIRPAVVPSSNAADADYPSTAVQLKLTGSTTKKTTTQWIRGIPDAIVANAGQLNPNGWKTWQASWNALVAKLLTSGWAMRTLVPSTPYFLVESGDTVTGAVVIPGNNYGPNGTVVKIRIKGCGTGHPFNGLWNAKVTNQSTATLQLSPWSPTSTNVPIIGKNPTSQLQVYAYETIGAASYGIISSHYTGRPTALLGGRRRRRRTASV